jgi:hypothetical protein
LFLVAITLAMTLPIGAAHAQERPHRFATLSLWDPISTNADREATTSLRIALIQSNIHSVKGLDITGIAGQLGGDLEGVQFTGIYSHVSGGGRGATFAGFGSYMGEAFTGVQAAGILNFNHGRFKGLQYSSLANFTADGMSGFQWAGTLNMNDGTGAGWQASSLANVSNGRFVGVQTSAAFNFANVGLKGIQIAGLNWTRHLKGAQVGLLNIAGDAHGLQVGVLNISEQNEGVPIGLLNIAENGTRDWMTWGGSYMGVQTGVRSTVNQWYSIFSIGGVYLDDTDLKTFSLGWHYGYEIEFNRRFSFSVDAGYIHLMPEKDPTRNDRLRPAVRGRGFLEWRFNEWAAVHAGVGGNYEWSEYASGADTQFDPLFFGGISLFRGEAR